MIIKIDNSISDALYDDNNENVIDIIEEICRIRRKGQAIIIISKNTALKIVKSEDLSKTQIATIKKIAEETTFNKNIKNNFHENILIIHSRFIDKNITTEIKNIKIIDLMTGVNNINFEPLLILENLDDEKVYKKIATWKLNRTNNLKGMRTYFKTIHGGGATTSKICENEIISGSFVYSICDSDMSSPLCELGDTAKSISTIFKKYGYDLNYHVINAHEVENLIPIVVLKNTARPEQIGAINFLDNIQSTENHSYLYYDMKEGFTYTSIWGRDESYSSYWRSIFETTVITDLDQNKINNAKAGKKINDVIFSRLSSMLPHALNNLDGFDNHDITPKSVEEQWNIIGSKLISWFLATKPLRV